MKPLTLEDRFGREIKAGVNVFFDRDGFSFPVVEVQEFKGAAYWVKVDHPCGGPKWFFDAAVVVDPTPLERKTYREKLGEITRRSLKIGSAIEDGDFKE